MTQRILRPDRHNTRSERGSVVVAMAALMLLLLIGTALVARSQVELAAVGADADAIAAEAAAEQGIAQALAQIEAGETGDFGGDGQAGEGKFAFKAARISETEYFVRAEGYVGDRVRAIEVTISGGAAATPYTLFVNAKGSVQENKGTITGIVGTNGGIESSGNPLGDVVHLHGPEASCRTCRSVEKFETALEMPEPTPPAGRYRSCPVDGTFSGVIDGASGTPYFCVAREMKATTVLFTDEVTVINPPLIIHVDSGLDIEISNASLNAKGSPSDFELYAEGGPDYYWQFNVFNSSVQGTIYAPGRYATVESAKFYGFLTLGVFVVEPPGEVTITSPDDVSTGVSGGWEVTSWEQVPAR